MYINFLKALKMQEHNQQTVNKNVGAQSSNCKHKTVKELKEIQKFWPKNYNNTVNLSWKIEIQIIKKL